MGGDTRMVSATVAAVVIGGGAGALLPGRGAGGGLAVEGRIGMGDFCFADLLLVFSSENFRKNMFSLSTDHQTDSRAPRGPHQSPLGSPTHTPTHTVSPYSHTCPIRKTCLAPRVTHTRTPAGRVYSRSSTAPANPRGPTRLAKAPSPAFVATSSTTPPPMARPQGPAQTKEAGGKAVTAMRMGARRSITKPQGGYYKSAFCGKRGPFTRSYK